MSEINPTRKSKEIHTTPLNWEITPEEVRAMSQEQLRETVIDLNEKVRRLYEATESLGVFEPSAQVHLTLMPENNRYDEYLG